MKYKYTGYSADGARHAGHLESESYAAAHKVLEFQGILVTELLPDEVGLARSVKESIIRLRIGGDMFASIFFREFGTLYAAMGIDEALRTMARVSDVPAANKIFDDIMTAVINGKSFAEALKTHEIIFGADAVAAIDTAERSGNLQEMAAALADELKRRDEIFRKVRGALIYPAVVVVAALVAAAILINVTLPVITGMYGEFGAEVPFVTKIFLTGGAFVEENLPTLILAAFLLPLLATIARREIPGVRRAVDKMLLEIALVRKKDLRNFFSQMSMMTEAGMSAEDSLKLTAATCGNVFMSERLATIAERTVAGAKISEAISESLPLGRLYFGILTAGELGGALPEMFARCAEIAAAEVDDTLQTLPAKAEIAGVLFAGLLVAFLVMAVMVPILNFSSLM